MGSSKHIPVMVEEVLEWLNPRPGQIIVDATLGVGEHSQRILGRIKPGGMLLGLEVDPTMISRARENLEEKGYREGEFKLYNVSYVRIQEVLEKCGERGADGILIDAGICTDQIWEPGRGFSFSLPSPLDARFNQEKPGITAADIVNRWTWQELADIFWKYGDEPRSRRIARVIVEYRDKKPIETTDELARIVLKAVGGRRHGRRIHEATRVFQSLRIVTNDELAELEKGIRQALGVLKRSSRCIVISYHSGEDRIVKNLYKMAVQGELSEVAGKNFAVLTKKPIQPLAEEIRKNPKARSAKMRVIERTA